MLECWQNSWQLLHCFWPPLTSKVEKPARAMQALFFLSQPPCWSIESLNPLFCCLNLHFWYTCCWTPGFTPPCPCCFTWLRTLVICPHVKASCAAIKCLLVDSFFVNSCLGNSRNFKERHGETTQIDILYNIYIYTHTVYIYIYTYTYTNIYIFIHIVYIHMHIHTHKYIYIYIVYIYICIYIYINKLYNMHNTQYTHTYIYILCMYEQF